MPIKTYQNRVEKHSIPITECGCWVWLGATVGKEDNKNNYGYIEGMVAHRFSYISYKGYIPKGLVVAHLCHNRLCVNPEHLQPMTQRENLLMKNSYSKSLTRARKNSLKTHCKQGHLLLGDNLYIKPNGSRNCKLCREFARQKFYSK